MRAVLSTVLIVTICVLLSYWVVYSRRGVQVEKFADNWIYDHVDKALIVCMPQRRNHMASYLDSVSFHAEYVEAIDQNTLHEDTLQSACNEEGTCQLLQQHNLSLAEIACYLSHLKALKVFIDDKDAHVALIMEDDLKPVEPIDLMDFKSNVNRVFEVTPKDWQFINMGPCWTWCEARKPVDADGVVYDSHSSKCSHFYVLTKAAAQEIYTNSFPLYNIPYDVKINILARQKKIRMYESGIQVAKQDRVAVQTLLHHYDDMPVCNTNIVHPKRRFLIFTSAGDQSRWYKHWTCAMQIFDVCVVYYGAGTGTEHAANATEFKRMNGGKFQNLYTWYHANPNVLDGYDYVAVWDDDIEIDCEEIHKIFGIAEKFDLWICQPSFTHDSKVSHEHTANEPGKLLTYTNFVEMNAPVFRTDKLRAFLDSPNNNGSLYGYGTDFLYHACMGSAGMDKFAIIHSVTCRNPRDDEKPKGREISMLASQAKREGQWHAYMQKFNVPTLTPMQYASL